MRNFLIVLIGAVLLNPAQALVCSNGSFLEGGTCRLCSSLPTNNPITVFRLEGSFFTEPATGAVGRGACRFNVTRNPHLTANHRCQERVMAPVIAYNVMSDGWNSWIWQRLVVDRTHRLVRISGVDPICEPCPAGRFTPGGAVNTRIHQAFMICSMPCPGNQMIVKPTFMAVSGPPLVIREVPSACRVCPANTTCDGFFVGHVNDERGTGTVTCIHD